MKIKDLCINKYRTLKEAMKKMDRTGMGIVLATRNGKFEGLITDSDIRRAVLDGADINSSVNVFLNKDPVILEKGFTEYDVSAILREINTQEIFPVKGALQVPILDNGVPVNIAFMNQHGFTGSFLEGKETRKVERVLVVGGAGYLGSVLCRQLLDKGYKVRVLDNLMYTGDGLKNLLPRKNFNFFAGDIREIKTVVNAVKDVDAVIHLASIVGDPAYSLDPEETIEINYFATKLLAEVCKYSQINRFIFASSCSVYGTSEKQCTEETETFPLSLYAKMKLKSEKAILEIADENFAPTVLRMSTLFGLSDRMRFDIVVNLLSAQAKVEKEINIFGGSQWRPFLHVEDASDAYIKCLEAPIELVGGETFNTGSSDLNYTINDIGSFIKDIHKETEVFIDKRNMDKRNYNVSFDKINNILSFSADKTVEDGIREIISNMKKFKNYKDNKYNNYNYLKGT